MNVDIEEAAVVNLSKIFANVIKLYIKNIHPLSKAIGLKGKLLRCFTLE